MKQSRIVLVGMLVVAVLLSVSYIARPTATTNEIDSIPLWIISGNFSDERREFNGTLKTPGSESVQIVQARLTGIGHGSPNASSRRVRFTLHCDTIVPVPLSWHLQKERSGPLENQSSLGCGEHYQTFLSVGYSDIFITLRLATSIHPQVLRYRLNAQVTAAAP